jgi:hypothetical protein
MVIVVFFVRFRYVFPACRQLPAGRFVNPQLHNRDERESHKRTQNKFSLYSWCAHMQKAVQVVKQ